MQVDGAALRAVGCVCSGVVMRAFLTRKSSTGQGLHESGSKTEVVRGHPDICTEYTTGSNLFVFPPSLADTGLGWIRSAAHMACV